MKKLLTSDDVAGLLQVHIQTVRKWLLDGKLPGVKVGDEWRVKPDDLEAWVEQNRTEGTKDSYSAELDYMERETLRIIRMVKAWQNADSDAEKKRLKAEIAQGKEALKRRYRAVEEAEGR